MLVAKQEKEAEWKAEAEEHDYVTGVIQKCKGIITSGFNTAFL
jgi:hypothetical protein